MVNEASSWSSLCRSMGNGVAPRTLQTRVYRENIDTSHFKRVVSKLDTISTETFGQMVKESSNWTQITLKLGMRPGGANFKSIRTRMCADGIDTSHFRTNKNKRKRYTLDEILVENSTYQDGSALKKRLFRELGWKNECRACHLSGTWNEKPIMMQLDHINGIHTDNRIENLRLLCPNCHSQTDTFCGRNKKNKSEQQHCIVCGEEIYSTATRCLACNSKQNATHGKPIEATEVRTGKKRRFASAYEAARTLAAETNKNMNRAHISNCANKRPKYNTHHGYTFAFVES